MPVVYKRFYCGLLDQRDIRNKIVKDIFWYLSVIFPPSHIISMIYENIWFVLLMLCIVDLKNHV
jgi:hypothetical protein